MHFRVYNYGVLKKQGGNLPPKRKKENKMKKIISLILALTMLLGAMLVMTSCDLLGGGETEKIYVQTNAFFAPFEYYEGNKIVGVDVEIMELVGQKMNKEIVWQDGEFGVIIDVVSAGKKADCGAAGLTITEKGKGSFLHSLLHLHSVCNC